MSPLDMAGKSAYPRAPAPARKAAVSEDTIHRAIVAYIRTVLPSAIVLHIPNAPRSAIAGARLKSLGMVKGAPDLLVCLPRGAGLFVEVKSERGRLKPEQHAFADMCAALNWPHVIARSVDDIQRAFVALGIKTRAA